MTRRLTGLVLLVGATAYHEDNSTIHVVILQRMSDSRFASEESCGPSWADGHCWLGSGWQAVAVSGLAAVADFNARNGTFAPALAGEQMAACDKQMEVTLLDSQSAGQTALTALFEAGLFTTQPQPDIIIGAARSAANVVTAVLTGTLEIPQISYWSTSPKLSDTDLFPRFMRTIPDDTVVAQSVCQLVQGFGYHFLSVIALDDAWGQGWADALNERCIPLGLEVLVYHYDPDVTDPDVTGSIASAVRQASSGTQASSATSQDNVLVLPGSTQECDTIVDTALQTGLLGSGLTQWLFTESCIGDVPLQNPEAIAALDGSLQIQAAGASDTNPLWLAFADSFAARDPAAYNAWLPASWQLDDDFFTSIDPLNSVEVRDIATFEYDAVVAAGLLACNIAPTGPLPAEGLGPSVWEAKGGFTFDGLSGTVSFDDEGDRNVSSANIQLYNVIEVNAHVARGGTASTPSTPAHMTLDLSSVNASTLRHHKWPIAEYQDGEWEYHGDIVYAGGHDYPPRKLHVSLLQRMSDARYLSADSCGAGFSDGTCWMSEGWQAIAVAALKAISDFNNREGAFAPALAGEDMLRCDKQISYTLLDSGSTGPTSVLASTSAIYSWPVPNVIIGPALSASSQASATVLGFADIPQISYASTSTDLDDTTLYPRFMRTIPNDLAPATSICKFWAVELGLTQAALLHASDIYGRACRHAVFAACDAVGLEVVDFEFEHAGQAKARRRSMANAVAQLAETRIEVVLCISIGAQDTAVIVAAALEHGLMAVGSSWAFTDGLTAADADAVVAELGDEAREALHGSLQIRAVGATDDNPRWISFADEWWPSAQERDFNPVLPREWQLPDGFFSTFNPRTSGELMHAGTFEYDAIVAAGIYACQITPRGPLPSDFGTRFWDHKQNTTIEGLTGEVAFDADGNRDIATANVQLLNMIPGADGFFEVNVVAHINGDSWAWVGGDRVASGSVFNRNEPTPPTDPPELEREFTQFEKMRQRVIYGTTGGFALILVCVTFFGRRSWLRYKALREGTMRYFDDGSECIPHMPHPPAPVNEATSCPIAKYTSSKFNDDFEAATFIQRHIRKLRKGNIEKQHSAASSIQRVYRGRRARAIVAVKLQTKMSRGLGKTVKQLHSGSIRATAHLGASTKDMLHGLSHASSAIGAKFHPISNRCRTSPTPDDHDAEQVVFDLPKLGTEERELLELAATWVQHKWRTHSSYMKTHGKTHGSKSIQSDVVDAAHHLKKDVHGSRHQLMRKMSMKKETYLAIQHSEELDYDLFLSHVWGSGGGQEKMRLLKVKLKEMMPALRIFLDVDDLKEGRGMEGIDSTHVILTFLTQGYFLSPNCMREMLRAVTTGKPIIVVGTQEKGGGIPINEVRDHIEIALRRLKAWGLNNEVKEWGYEVPTADEMHDALFRYPTVEFDPIAPFQMIWFRKIAEMLLVRGHSECYVRGEMTIQSLQHEQLLHKTRPKQKPKPILHPPRNRCKYHLYCSPFNVGAARLCLELERFLQLADPLSKLLHAGHSLIKPEVQPEATMAESSKAKHGVLGVLHMSRAATKLLHAGHSLIKPEVQPEATMAESSKAKHGVLHRAATSVFSTYPVGSRVHHPSHGPGTVVKGAGDRQTRIRFDKGQSHTYRTSSICPSWVHLSTALQDLDASRADGGDDAKTFTMASASDLLECETMLLYLTADTWTSGEMSKKLASEVMLAMTAGVKVVLVHEAPSWDNKQTNACPFESFFSCERGATPVDLLHAGVYRSIANALRAEPLRTASFVMLVKSLGAADNFVRKPNEMLVKSQLAVVDRMASFSHEQKEDEELREVVERSRARRAAKGTLEERRQLRKGEGSSGRPSRAPRAPDLAGLEHLGVLREGRDDDRAISSISSTSKAGASDDDAEESRSRGDSKVSLKTPTTVTRTINASLTNGGATTPTSSSKGGPKRQMSYHYC